MIQTNSFANKNWTEYVYMDAFKTVAAFNKYLHNYDIVQMQRKY